MKVLMINSVCGTGSTGRICTDLADSLTANGDDCRLVYGRGTAPEKYHRNSYKFCSENGFRLNALKSRLFDNEGFNAKTETKKLLKYINEYGPDVIHLHNLHGYYINIELLFNYLSNSGAKVVWTLHDCWSFTGHCAHYLSNGCDKWITGCHNCSKVHGYPSSFFLDNSAKNYLKKKQCFTSVKSLSIVTPSQWLANEVKKSFLGGVKTVVINNGIDKSIFKKTPSDFRRKNGLEGKKIILGVSSVWSENKGLDDFIKLSETLDESCKIVVVGVSKAQLNSIPKNILAFERTESLQDLVEIYSSADVLFNPTYQDTYPTVNLEAQSCGTPVITYATGGSVESVPNENVIEVGNYLKVKELLETELKISHDIASKEDMLQSYLNVYKG